VAGLPGTRSVSREHQTEATFAGHEPCPDCDSSDGLARYDDGHGYCFAGCSEDVAYKHADGDAPPKQEIGVFLDHGVVVGQFPVRGSVQRLEKRGLSEVTCAKWRYEVGVFKSKPVQIANYIRDGVVVAQKVRFPNKDFTFLGNPKTAGLYGQHLWRDGGKMVVITEGEIDALSVSQLQDNKWPVVSAAERGAGREARPRRSNIEWLDQFESVDPDVRQRRAGPRGRAGVRPLFSPRQVQGRAPPAEGRERDARRRPRQGK
jgi:twinkle protein